MASPPSSQLLALSPALLLTFFFFTLNYFRHVHAHQNFLSSTPRRFSAFSDLLTQPAGFVGPHCSTALKDRGHGALGLGNFNDYHHPSRPALWSMHPIFLGEGGLHDARPFCELFHFQTVPFAHILHLAAAQFNSDGFVNLLDIANPADPQPAILWASSSSISGRTSRINPKHHPTITTRGLVTQLDRKALKKRVHERASLVESIDGKQVATGGMERFHGDPNIPEKEGINNLGKGDSEGMNGGKDNYKLFPHMHPLGRRLLHKGSPTPPLVAVSRASGPIPPSGPSACTHIPKGKGHC